MGFIKRLTVLLIVTLVMYIGCLALLFVTHWLTLSGFTELATLIYKDDQLRLIAGGIAVFILFINFLLYSMFSVSVRRDKVIAFDNPSGRVSVSLSAIEDLIKRILSRMSEVKDSKIVIRAAHRGLHIEVKLSLMSDVNIPGLTSRVQDAILSKVQDTIGLEEKIDVQIYIGKISAQEYRETKNHDEPKKENPTTGVPYHGYRA